MVEDPTVLNIRRIREEDLSEVRSLRLTALATDPLAFGSTLAREQAFDEATWTDRAHRGATAPLEATWVAEHPSEGLVGMIGVFPTPEEFHMVALWVVPSARGRGVGRRLVRQLLDWCAVTDPARPVLLSVNPRQRAAVSLYLASGFRPTGRVEPLGHTPDEVVHEMRWQPAPP
jgi:ribosomal protein S18 acetylase RimI-like enzyme